MAYHSNSRTSPPRSHFQQSTAGLNSNGFYQAQPQAQIGSYHDDLDMAAYYTPDPNHSQASIDYGHQYNPSQVSLDHSQNYGGSRAHLVDPQYAQPVAGMSPYPPPQPQISPSHTFNEKVPMPYSPYDQQGSYFSPSVVGGFSVPSPYGQVREKVLNRRENQQIQLTDGHLVLDCPVPQSILTYAKDYGGNGGDEFKKMRDDFMREKYSLRQYLFRRSTELAIVLTMYNEDEKLFENTMTSVVKNIQHLQGRTRSNTWGDKAWQKVVVTIVADGRAKVNQRVLKMLGLMGVYQDGIAKDTVAGKDVHAHIFEYSTQVVVDAQGNVSGGIVPVQICFVLKEQNKKKLNSHRWFFNAVCAQLIPTVCILIDVGTRPSGTSLYALWKTFDKHKSVGGACGEITVDTGRGCSNLLNPLVAAQNFEYKMSNILDKSTESVFGFISVLPGAFSAYRYKALRGAPLNAYFHGEKMHEPGYVGSASDSNMYLAEDRILCFEMVTKKGESWLLRYVKSAKASTDVPDRLPEYISQRRRWLNGSLFAALHATLHFYRIWTSGHNPLRMLWLQIEFIYNLVNILFTFTGIANMYLAFQAIGTAALTDPDHLPFGNNYSDDILELAQNAWLALIFTVLILSLGNRPQGSQFAYYFVTVTWSLLFGLALYCAAWTIYLAILTVDINTWSDVLDLLKQSGFRDIVISLLSTYGLYLISSILHLEPWHMITCFVQYMLLLPATVNILSIYSMCNLHDVSWGTKGSTGPAKDLGGAKKQDGKETVEVSIPTAPKDIDNLWMAMRKELSTPVPEQKSKRSADQKQEDHMRTFRTNTVLLYAGVNMTLVLFFTSAFFKNWVKSELNTRGSTNPYLSFIFWSVAGLAAFRAFGSTMYLILRICGH